MGKSDMLVFGEFHRGTGRVFCGASATKGKGAWRWGGLVRGEARAQHPGFAPACLLGFPDTSVCDAILVYNLAVVLAAHSATRVGRLDTCQNTHDARLMSTTETFRIYASHHYVCLHQGLLSVHEPAAFITRAFNSSRNSSNTLSLCCAILSCHCG